MLKLKQNFFAVTDAAQPSGAFGACGTDSGLARGEEREVKMGNSPLLLVIV